MIADLDVESYQARLSAERGAMACTIRPPRAFAAALADALANEPAPFLFEHEVESERLRMNLTRAVKAQGLAGPLGDALIREVAQIARFFSGVTGDPHPHVHLAFAPSVEKRPRPAPTMSLLCPLLGRARVRLEPSVADDLADASQPLQTLAVYPGDASGLEVAAPEHGDARDLWLLLSTTEVPYFLRPAPAAAPEPRPVTQRDVVLVSMPFGPLHQASLGLSLLAASLDQVSCEILYFTLAFARRVGTPFYAWISNSNPVEEALTGEWIFNRALFGEQVGEDRAYLEDVLGQVPACEIEDILRARAKAEEFLDTCVDQVLARRPKLVGFTSVFNQQVPSLALAQRLAQRCPELTIVFGGANCEGKMGVETVRQFDFVDAVVSGEGDLVFAQVVDSVLAGQGIPRLQGVYTRRSMLLAGDNPVNAPLVEAMDELPEPDFSDFFAQWHEASHMRGYRSRLMFESARGCWWGAKHHCTFCGLNGSGMRFRSKSGMRALGELRRLVADHPDSTVCVVDNILDMKYFKDFVPELAASRLPVQLFYETKANLKKSQIEALFAAGITTIQPGVESFSDDVLNLMRKGVSGLQNVQLLKWCAEIGVWPFWNVLWGFPGESPADYERMAELIPWLHHLPPPVACGLLRLDRFSPNFENSAELGFVDVRPFRSYGHIYPFPDRALANVAYYFDYGYADGRDPGTYTEAVKEAVATWKESFDHSHVLYLDKGQNLVIWDTRAAARKQMTVLGATERAVYLACDGATPVSRLPTRLRQTAQLTLSVPELEELVAPLVRDGLMLRMGDQLISLALPQPAAAVRASRPVAAG